MGPLIHPAISLTRHGLDEDETWRDVGVLFGGTVLEPVQQTITTACHHCLDPACMNGCPLNAYDKDPVTGIVRHLDDQCIGCQYCTWKCPYDVPVFKEARDCPQVRDVLESARLEEAPACVQACPNEAISITLVNKQQIADQRKKKNSFLPGSPDSDYTLPTTQYRTRRTLPASMSPGDLYEVKAEVKKVSRAPGQALSDFNIFKLVAQYWGCGKMFDKWSSPESVFQIMKELSRDQPCEITGIRNYRMIDEAG